MLKNMISKAWACSLFSFMILGKASSKTKLLLAELENERRGGTFSLASRIVDESTTTTCLDAKAMIEECVAYY
jgi:hypothetical protein